jgi:hypothetical protein
VKNISYALSSKLTKEIRQNDIYYFIYYSEKETKLIKFSNAGTRDIALERMFVKAIVQNLIPKQQFTSYAIDTINFVDRKINLGPICRWMKPRNVQCKRFGQMNWSEHRTLDRAKVTTQIQHDLTESHLMVKLLEEKEIAVMFEGVKTTALMTKWKITIPRLPNGSSNILITYYVTEKIRDKFVSCTMSHYSDEAPEGKLPKMLSEIMQLEN